MNQNMRSIRRIALRDLPLSVDLRSVSLLADKLSRDGVTAPRFERNAYDERKGHLSAF